MERSVTLLPVSISWYSHPTDDYDSLPPCPHSSAQGISSSTSPLTTLTYTPRNVRRRLPHNHPQHDRGRCSQAIPVVFPESASRPVVLREGVTEPRITHQVKMYCAWLFRSVTSAGLPMGTPVASISEARSQSGSGASQRGPSKQRACNTDENSPMVASIHTGWLPVRAAIWATSGK